MNADAARNDLYEVMKQDLGFEAKAERALEIGEQYLDVDNGHVARIDFQSSYWKAIASTDPPDGAYPPDLVLDLDTTYCRRTASQSDPVALHDAPNQGWEDDPAFEAHGLHCYHGTTITIAGEAYGTVCFVSESPRGEPFSDAETMFAELVARMLEHEIRLERTSSKLDRFERFADVLTHDLRNPLTVALGRVDHVRKDRDSEHLRVAANALDRIDAIISDVLTMARQGRALEETEQVSLASVVEQCWDSVDTADAELVVDDDLTLTAASSRLESLFENLFRNAVEHGSESVSIRVGPLPDGQGFVVEDDGPGIPRDQRSDVFTTGFSTGGEGLGVGLSIVEGVATAHEWDVCLTESPSDGARFEFSDVVVPDTASG